MQDCVLFCLYFDLSFSYSVVLLRFEARAALTYRIHFCVPSSIFVLRPLRLSWFKLSLVMVLHAVACCPVSCANNCSFVGLHWELHQGIHLFLLFFFFFFFFPPRNLSSLFQGIWNSHNGFLIAMCRIWASLAFYGLTFVWLYKNAHHL